MEQRIYQGIISLLFLLTNSTFQAQMAWNLVWSEEFSGTTLNEEVWNYEIGFGNAGWGNNELQYYRSGESNLIVADGKAYKAYRHPCCDVRSPPALSIDTIPIFAEPLAVLSPLRWTLLAAAGRSA